MPLHDRDKVMTYIYNNREDWSTASLSYTYGQNGAVRGASQRKLSLCDLRLSKGFGPAKEGSKSRALMLIMRSGRKHKDRFSTTRQVCLWPHKNYKLDSVFATGMAVIYKLREKADSLNFKKKAKQRAKWWDIQLLDWDRYDEHRNAAKAIYEGAGVASCKRTHERTNAIQYAGSEGLAPWQINTFTNHILDKLNSAYQSEADKEACLVMAGFNKSESHYLPEDQIRLPSTVEYYVKKLLPLIEDYRRQSSQRGGDKSLCCDNFLNELLPFLVETVVRRGIWFIRDFPTHPFAEVLKDSIDNYEHWAGSQRDICRSLLQNRGSEKINELNTAARHSYEDMQSRQDALSIEVRQLKDLNVVHRNQYSALKASLVAIEKVLHALGGGGEGTGTEEAVICYAFRKSALLKAPAILFSLEDASSLLGQTLSDGMQQEFRVFRSTKSALDYCYGRGDFAGYRHVLRW